ncbi:unnamed protein product [Adineta ricciae]|uniref:Ig-like domain-containing protein n=1 Tax=Adineta ricciae TaxID=249248 RepID=A0A814E3M1_ADIRI|nr:unnamed protein product [Adineta ricciae]CAF1195010.1 unnamed protein product [Adineta ricciae]
MYYSFLTFFNFTILIGLTTTSTLLNQLRKHKTITFQSKFSSPKEIQIVENTKFNLTCLFLSNFPQIDIFWLHNGTLIQSFLSKTKENEDENSFLAVSIVSTISIEKVHFDMNGFYQCIGVHQEIYAQQTFTVNLNLNDKSDVYSIPTNFIKDSSFIIHSAQALFEPRKSLSLFCRVGTQQKQCRIQWFNPNDELINTLGENTDLDIANATFEINMGLYTCEICCTDHCQKLTSFVYPAEEDEQK